jgi:hypothetical protein
MPTTIRRQCVDTEKFWLAQCKPVDNGNRSLIFGQQHQRGATARNTAPDLPTTRSR